MWQLVFLSAKTTTDNNSNFFDLCLNKCTTWRQDNGCFWCLKTWSSVFTWNYNDTLHHTGEAIINPPAYQTIFSEKLRTRWSVLGTLLWEDHLCYLPVTSGCFPCRRLASLSLTSLCRAPGIWSKVHEVSAENHLEAENGCYVTIALGKIGSFYNSTSLLAFSLKPLL